MALAPGEQLAGRLRVVDDRELGRAVGEVLADQDRVLVDLDEGDEDVGVGGGGRLADQALLGLARDLLGAALAAEDLADGLLDRGRDLLVEVQREQREEDERDDYEDARVVGGGDAALIAVGPPEHGAETTGGTRRSVTRRADYEL